MGNGEWRMANAEGSSIQFMQSQGGLVDGHQFSGLRSIIFGPAGGVVGYSSTCYNQEKKHTIDWARYE